MEHLTQPELVPSSLTEKRCLWIDHLRGIAILMVIAVHTSHGLKGSDSTIKTLFGFGGYGVQLFFVASAMTLCMSIQNSYGQPGWLRRYVVRRFFRIAPMYYIGIVLYFFWSFIKNYIQNGVVGPLPQYTISNVLANLFFVHGFFPEAYNNIVPGGWSIGTEVSFYVIFPLLFIAFRIIKNPLIPGTLFLVSCYFLISLIQRWFGESTSNSEFLYFNISNQLQVFIIGMTGYYMLPAISKISSLFVCIIAIFMAWIGYYIGSMDMQNVQFFLLAAYACTFVGLAALAQRLELNFAWLVRVGQRSFSMYIVHFMFMNMIDYGFNRGDGFLMMYQNLKALVHFGIAVLVTYWIAGTTKRWVEDPCIYWGRRLIKTRSTVEN